MTPDETRRFRPVKDNYRTVDTRFRTEDRTIGSWPTETAAAAALDVVLDDCGLFDVYKEVPGELQQPIYPQKAGPVRIDRVLVPRPHLLHLGWDHRTIGIETKRSGEAIGPALTQMLDYRRSIFHLPTADIHLAFVFLWSAQPQHYATESVMAQYRVGVAWSTDRYPEEADSCAGRSAW